MLLSTENCHLCMNNLAKDNPFTAAPHLPLYFAVLNCLNLNLHPKLAMLLDFHNVLSHLNIFFYSSNLEIGTQFRKNGNVPYIKDIHVFKLPTFIFV